MEETRKMTLTLEAKDSGRKVQITCSEDSDIFDIMGELRGLLIAWGYHPTSIIDGASYLIEEFGEEEKENNE